ncbi:hypothetical protein [Nocardia blacklockiae]|uniref:hypothetical protein n=1 Tax=Nocardia blacklockiae TaxID=480036 RepID=UPI001893EFB9|nr:hypothetical protein [Nocardia blacklockiae]MBF6171116.1 hypothetical protein [Nocardia blacklockiae]
MSMMRHRLAAAMVLTAATMVVTGCNQEPAAPIPTSAVPRYLQGTPASGNPALPHNIGDKVTVPAKSLSGVAGVAEYTLSNIHRDGEYLAIDLAINCTAGDDYVMGTFQVLTKSGKKVEQDIHYAPDAYPDRFDYGGAMVSGEKRSGAILFDTTDDVQKVYLYHGTINPPVAVWAV